METAELLLAWRGPDGKCVDPVGIHRRRLRKMQKCTIF
jgi:hypothetical protein